MSKKRVNKGSIAIKALRDIEALEPPACSDESFEMTEASFRDRCRNMARVARVALHEMGEGKKDV